MTNQGEVEELRIESALFTDRLQNVFFKITLNCDDGDIIARFEDQTDMAWFEDSTIEEWQRRAAQFARNADRFETVNGLEAWVESDKRVSPANCSGLGKRSKPQKDSI
jgi:hypothetical protein